MSSPLIDLHTHSTASDGTYSPVELVAEAARRGVRILAITDHDGMYARNPSTDGQRIVYHVAGDIWILDSPEAAEPRKLEITLGSPAAARAPRLVSAEDHLGGVDCDQTGQASVVEVRGTVHWLTHKDGPARALHVDPAARARASDPRYSRHCRSPRCGRGCRSRRAARPAPSSAARSPPRAWRTRPRRWRSRKCSRPRARLDPA